MAVPDEYRGREQSYLKHLVLKEYLGVWGHKLGKTGKKLWYVDAFAGPWGSKSPDLKDTSIDIGRTALMEAADSWGKQGRPVQIGAVFVEADEDAFELLQQHVAGMRPSIDAHAFKGPFSTHVAEIGRLLGNDAAFVFVDPKGWLGAEMRHIAPLVAPRFRDVLINVMFNFINIAQGSKQQVFQSQLDDFFGLSADEKRAAKLNEESLLRFYRQKLSVNCGLPFTGDIAIPKGAVDRTWFRLVVGGHDPVVLDVFRHAERKVAGLAAGVREEAKRERRSKTKLGLRQPELLLTPTGADPLFDKVRQRDLARIGELVANIVTRGAVTFGQVWPRVLSELHVTKTDVGQEVARMHADGRLRIVGLRPRERTPKDEHALQPPE